MHPTYDDVHCEACVYFCPSGVLDDNRGECRVTPPSTPQPANEFAPNFAVWPDVYGGQWCGSFRDADGATLTHNGHGKPR